MPSKEIPQTQTTGKAMPRRGFLEIMSLTGSVLLTAAFTGVGKDLWRSVRSAENSPTPTSTPTPDKLSTESSPVNPEFPFAKEPKLFVDFHQLADGTLLKDIPGEPLKILVRDKKNGTAEVTTADPGNVRIEKSHLVIQANVPVNPNEKITSGEVVSSENFHYGRMVVRARLAAGAGSFSALWLQSSALPGDADLVQAGDPKGYLVHGEIDLEHQGADAGRVAATTWTHDTKDSAYQKVADAETAFHTYEIQWTPAYVAFLVDGVQFTRKEKPTDAKELNWPFDNHVFHLVMNLAVGGTWAASFAKKQNLPPDGIDRSVAERQLQIESVAIYPYQAPDSSSQPTTPTATP